MSSTQETKRAQQRRLQTRQQCFRTTPYWGMIGTSKPPNTLSQVADNVQVRVSVQLATGQPIMCQTKVCYIVHGDLGRVQQEVSQSAHGSVQIHDVVVKSFDPDKISLRESATKVSCGIHIDTTVTAGYHKLSCADMRCVVQLGHVSSRQLNTTLHATRLHGTQKLDPRHAASQQHHHTDFMT